MDVQTIHEVVECCLTLILCAEIDESERTRVSLSLECIQAPCKVACSTILIRSRSSVVVTPRHIESAKVVVLLLLVKVPQV
jgi:hypothetical protein